MKELLIKTIYANTIHDLAEPNLPEDSGLFAKTFYGNTDLDWAQTALIIIAALVAGKVHYWLIGKTIKRLAAKTKTQFDDIVVDMAEEPFVLGVVIMGFWYGLSRLTLSQTA